MAADGADDVDPTTAHDAASLARCLHALWVKADKPSHRQVENETKTKGGEIPHSKLKRVPIGRTLLGEVLKGKFPSKVFLLTFVEYCGVDLQIDQRWESTWNQIALHERVPDLPNPPFDPTTSSESMLHTLSINDSTVAEAPMTIDVAFVSCDMIGHSLNPLEEQVRNVSAINKLVANFVNSAGGAGEFFFWVSGGDGGHVVITGDNWKKFAWKLIVELRSWTAKEMVPLRVIAHYGPVVRVTGADGRPQFVGDSINLAEWILNVGSGDGVVVSDAFRQEFEKARPEISGVIFHEKRTLRDKNSTPEELWLISSESDRSNWGLPTVNDRALLKQVVDDRNNDGHDDGWSILYAAKRVMQINPDDSEAIDAIYRLSPTSLTYLTSGENPTTVNNPFLSHLESATLCEVVQFGELIERRSNEIICRHGERGETMFAIVRGQVGVYKSEGRGSGNPAEPAFVMSEGEIIGELAFTLGHTRTADLVTLSDTALLSFNMTDIMNRLSPGPQGQRTRKAVRDFIDSRVLEHVSDNTKYLLDNEDNVRKGPLTAGYKSWRDALSTLETECRLITLDPTDLVISIDHVQSALLEDEPSMTGVYGLFILANGQVRAVDPVGTLDETKFPIIWVTIPGVVTRNSHSYTVIEGPIKILYIAASAIGSLEGAKRAALYKAIQQKSTNI
jgi:class 3 adenylate cyclase